MKSKNPSQSRYERKDKKGRPKRHTHRKERRLKNNNGNRAKQADNRKDMIRNKEKS